MKTYADMVIKPYCYPHDIGDSVERIYLHGFSDASQIAFGASIYMKAMTEGFSVSILFNSRSHRYMHSFSETVITVYSAIITV